MTKTAAELRQELDRKNSEARNLRRKLREAEKQEMLSAKIALGEALSALVSADTTEALQALVQTLNEPATANELRRFLGVNNTESEASEETEDEALWASSEDDDQPDSHDAFVSF